MLRLRKESVPEPVADSAEAHGNPDHRDRPAEQRDRKVDDHRVQQREPVVAVRDQRAHPAPETGASARILPVGANDRALARPVEAYQFQCAEAARDVQRADEDEDADEDREDGADTGVEHRDRDGEAGGRDREARQQEAKLARDRPPQAQIEIRLPWHGTGRRGFRHCLDAHGSSLVSVRAGGMRPSPLSEVGVSPAPTTASVGCGAVRAPRTDPSGPGGP